MKLSERKKRLALGVSSVMLVMATVGYAYLTAHDGTVNTFTVNGDGNPDDFSVELNEPNWDLTDDDGDEVPDASQDLVPNQEVLKDPYAENTGIERSVMFMVVTVPVREVTLVNDDGTDGSVKKLQEIFYMKDVQDKIIDHRNNFNIRTADEKNDPIDNDLGNWIELPDYEVNVPVDGIYQDNSATAREELEGSAYRSYVFGYAYNVAPGNVTNTLFDKVQVKNIRDTEISSDTIQNITVDVFSIQADNLIGATGDVAEGDTVGKINVEDGMSYAELNEIFSMYLNQEMTTDAADNTLGTLTPGQKTTINYEWKDKTFPQN